MALHKMIRLVTLGLGGEGYLTFMGNEFGHTQSGLISLVKGTTGATSTAEGNGTSLMISY